MAFVLSDRVKETTSSTGTGPFVLAGVSGANFEAFGDRMADNDVTWACIDGGATGEWVTAKVRYSAGSDALEILKAYESSEGDDSVPSFSSGTKTVFMTVPARWVAGGFVWTFVTANTTAQAGQRIAADTSGGPVTITLPASPSDGDTVFVADPAWSWGSSAVTIDANGGTIENVGSLSYSTANLVLQVTYYAGESAWRVLGRDDRVYPGFGETSGYTSGGNNSGNLNIIDKFSFASDGNATDVGDLTNPRDFTAGQSSLDFGYTSGGDFSNVIDKFSFASDGNAIDVGDLTSPRESAVGQSSLDFGYTSGGNNSGNLNIIDKFSFASDGNATDVGDLTVARRVPAGQSSVDFGYTSGGANPGFVDVIDKFSFASDGNASDVGDLTDARDAAAGQSSADFGYTSSGSSSNVIDKFSFASDGNATDVGDSTVVREWTAGQSSADFGYTSGGDDGSPSNVIDKFSFASDGNATDVGDLTMARYGVAGQWV